MSQLSARKEIHHLACTCAHMLRGRCHKSPRTLRQHKASLEIVEAAMTTSRLGEVAVRCSPLCFACKCLIIGDIVLPKSGRVDLGWLITHRLPLPADEVAINLLTGDAGKVPLVPSLG